MKLFAGIDGGQSSTIALIGDDAGTILGRGVAGPADEIAQSSDSTRLSDALSDALFAAAGEAALAADARFVRIVAGVSGYEGRVYGAAPDLPADDVQLFHDTVIAHAGAFGGGAGVVVIAGTGSVGYARNDRGDRVLVGGWGYLFGDEGSAFWMARTALSRAMRDEDAGMCTSEIAAAARAHFAVGALREISRGFYTGRFSRADVASFANELLHGSARNDGRILAIASEGAAALAELARAAARGARISAPSVVFMGGLMQDEGLRLKSEMALKRILPAAHVTRPHGEPAEGALLLARAGCT